MTTTESQELEVGNLGLLFPSLPTSISPDEKEVRERSTNLSIDDL